MRKELHLWDHQLPSVDGLRQGFIDGHRAQILMAPTGFGKSVVAAHLMRLTARNGKRVAFLVDRVSLVDQMSKTLDVYGIDHGVVQADHWRRRLYEPVQVCSVQSLEKRGFFPDIDMLIVDEAHEVRNQTIQFIKNNPKIKVVGLTATPFHKALGDTYTNLVSVVTTQQLIDMGELAPLLPYAAVPIDMQGAALSSKGEYSEKDLSDRGSRIVGDIVMEWQTKTQLHFQRPVKTIVFAATVAHGEELCRQFQAAGHNFQQISYQDSGRPEMRQAIIDEFRKPDSEITGLISCEVLTKGFDVSDVMCGISARPYRKSFSQHIQQLGRVMRKHPGKEFGLWLCHSGNFRKFQPEMDDLYRNGLSSLESGKKLDVKVRAEPSDREKENWTCSCGYIFVRRLDVCPACGKEHKRQNMVENVAGTMEAVGHAPPPEKKLPKYLQDEHSTWCQLCHLARHFKKDDLEAGRKFAQAQFRNLYGRFHDGKYDETQPEQISSSLKRRVLTDIRKYKAKQQSGATYA